MSSVGWVHGGTPSARRPRELPPLPRPGEPPLPLLPGGTSEIGGLRLHVRRTPVHGGAEPALFVHGLGGASTNWTDLMHLLAPWLAGEAPDLPGFGRSGPARDRDYSIDAHAAVVVALLERRGAPVHLFGNSLGGAIATRVAAERPELVRTLTLVAPALPTYLPSPTAARMPLLLMPGMTALLRSRARRLTPEAQVRFVLSMCYADPTRVSPERIREAAEELHRRSEEGHAQDALVRSLRGLITVYVAPGRRGLWRQATAVQSPTLLIFGARDRLVDVRMAPRAKRAFGRSRLVVLRDSGHVAQMESPRAVAGVVLDHLDAARDTPIS